jgi:uncharacterized protein (TIGR00661 family)
MKILYGLPSEGMGHATRSKVIISHLLEKHDVRIVTSDRAFTFMNSAFPGRVHQIRGLHFAFKNGEISKFKTVADILRKGPSDLAVNFNKYRQIHAAFEPDLVISDFESFTYYFAKYHRLPIISIDNMQVIARCRLEFPIPASERENLLITRNIIKAKLPRCDAYLITAFFTAPIERPSTYLVPPILRDSIVKAGPTVSRQGHILVYQTSTSQQNLAGVLQAVDDRTFFVYGFNKDETAGNVIYKKFSEEGFIADLASADAVVTNGGFSLISEAVYLHKPVCSMPIHGTFEQYTNAAYIQKLGFGRHFGGFEGDNIKAFLYDLPQFQRAIDAYRQDGNKRTFAVLDSVIGDIFG